MPSVTVYDAHNQMTIKATSYSNLGQILQSAAVSVSLPCSGRGTCGKCKAKVTGDVAPPESEELAFLSAEDVRNHVRLICRTIIRGDVTVVLPARGGGVLLQGMMPTFALQPLSDGQFGIALDIGTTTIAAYLYDMPKGELLFSHGEKNAQTAFGADVISRIAYADTHGVHILQNAIIRQIEDIIARLCNTQNIIPQDIGAMVITGNTTMLHMLRGLSVTSLGVSPFITQSTFGEFISANKLFAKLSPQTHIYLPPCISAFVGADITCCMTACELTKNKNALLLDIGTNGEIALWDGEKILCCSTAAGPAFEGAGIACGMPAMDGAIAHVAQEGESISFRTLSGSKSIGICGSGIVDALSVMRTTGIMDETGLLHIQGHHFEKDIFKIHQQPAYRIGGSDVYMTQEDIRKIQLAKAAVAAGIQTLLHEAGKTADEIEKVYIAGGFGTYIRQESAVNIALLPKAFKDKTIVIGNGAGSGAAAMLLCRDLWEKTKQLKTLCQEVSLAENATFMAQYMEQMMF